MKLKNHFVYILAFLVLASCGDPKPESDGPTDNGVRKTYRKDGSLLSEANYKDGKLDGVSKNYYDNGNVQNLITYKAGEKHGIVQTYYKDGVMNRETTYVEGKMDGYKKIFFQDGKVSSEQNFKNDLPGALTEYSSNGKPVESFPEMTIKPINNISKNREYLLEVTFSKNPKRAKYFDGQLIDGEFFDEEESLRLAQRNGVGYYRVKVNPGEVINQTVTIIGVLKTPRRNEYIVEKKYTISVRG